MSPGFSLECVLGYLKDPPLRVYVYVVNRHCLSNRLVTKIKMTYNP